jgi:hypothetical protein
MRNFETLKLTRFLKRNHSKISDKTLEIVKSIEKQFIQNKMITPKQYKLLLDYSYLIYVELNISDFTRNIND